MSETERKNKRNRHQSSKKDKIDIHRKEVVKVRAEELPADAQFKGYVDVVVQDIVVKTDNVLFRKEKYYSPSTGKTYLAELPHSYEGELGPGVKVFGLDMYFEVGASEPKIDMNPQEILCLICCVQQKVKLKKGTFMFTPREWIGM